MTDGVQTRRKYR